MKLTTLLAVLLSGVGLLAAPDVPPKAEDILQRYIDATGGADAHQNVHTQVATAVMEFTGKGLRGTVTMYQAEPAESYVSIDLEGVGRLEQGTNAGIAWEKSALQGPRIKSGAERDSALREADVHSRVFWKKHYDKAEVAGEEVIDGSPCYKVVLTPKEGFPETRFYAKETSLLLRVDRKVKTPMGEALGQTFLGDYRKSGDLLTPFRVQQKVLGQEIVTTLKSVVFNEPIPESRFQLPPDVAALVQK